MSKSRANQDLTNIAANMQGGSDNRFAFNTKNIFKSLMAGTLGLNIKNIPQDGTFSALTLREAQASQLQTKVTQSSNEFSGLITDIQQQLDSLAGTKNVAIKQTYTEISAQFFTTKGFAQSSGFIKSNEDLLKEVQKFNRDDKYSTYDNAASLYKAATAAKTSVDREKLLAALSELSTKINSLIKQNDNLDKNKKPITADLKDMQARAARIAEPILPASSTPPTQTPGQTLN